MFVVKLFNIDPSSYKMEGCEVNLFKTLERSKQFIMCINKWKLQSHEKCTEFRFSNHFFN